MDHIKKLKEIGLKKVSETTHIEEKFLQYMVDCNFEKLKHLHTHGFIKILTREYKIDFSSWLEAFDDYWTEHREEKEGKEKLFIFVERGRESKKLLKFTIFAIFIAIIVLLFSIFKNKINLENFKNENTSNYEQTDIIQETKKSLEGIGETNNSNMPNLQEKEIMLNDAIESGDNLEKKIISEAIGFQETITADELAQDSVAVSKAVTQEEVKAEKKSINFDNEAIIVPNLKLWIGLMYLDDKKRKSFLGEGNFSIDLSRDQIVTTGHGSFTLVTAGKKIKYSKVLPIKFLVKDRTLTEISNDRYNELSEGKSW